MGEKITFEKLRKEHLPFFYEIRFSVEENIVHPHQIQYLLRQQVLDDIGQGGGWICKINNNYRNYKTLYQYKYNKLNYPISCSQLEENGIVKTEKTFIYE